MSQRQDIPGGHQRGYGGDGGFSLLEPTDNERARLKAELSAAETLTLRWVDAAEHLAKVYDLARFSQNLTLLSEIRQAEARYDKAKTDALLALGKHPERRV
jgi:hypothetical protein